MIYNDAYQKGIRCKMSAIFAIIKIGTFETYIYYFVISYP